jgi:hypothetical protein
MFLIVIQILFLYVSLSIHCITQSVRVTQRNWKPARREHAPKHVLFVSKMF